jgi:hypothetical protein
LVLAGVGAATLLASFLYAPWSQTGPVLCPFRLATGLPCPGCGLTRSFCACAHGHWNDAIAAHLFGPILFAVLLIGVPLLFYQGLRGRPIMWLDRVLFSRRAAYVAAILLFGYHVLRLIHAGWSGTLWDGLRNSALAIVMRQVW